MVIKAKVLLLTSCQYKPEIVHKFDEEGTLACYHLTLSPTTISLLQGTLAQHANSELLPTNGSRHVFT